VFPHGVDTHLALADPSIRREQYRTAFSALLAAVPADCRVIFAENSGASLSDFGVLAEGRPHVEFLSLQPRDVPPGCGRGYLETLLVGDALAASSLINGGHHQVIKLTGRYRVANLARVLRSIPDDVDLAFNLRRYPRPWADMWLYGITRDGYEALASHVDALREDITYAPSEAILYYVLQHLQQQGASCALRFPSEPRFLGIRGNDGLSYSSPRQSLKWAARAASKRLFPRVWI
jgi:hypothetical protein